MSEHQCPTTKLPNCLHLFAILTSKSAWEMQSFACCFQYHSERLQSKVIIYTYLGRSLDHHPKSTSRRRTVEAY